MLRPKYEEDERLEYDGDRDEDARHFAAVDTERQRVVGVVSYLPEPLDLEGESAEVRLRGMAVCDGLQRCGIGSHLLSTTLTKLAVLNPRYDRVWAAARTSVVGFYEQHGFEVVGPRFEIPEAGPHRRMIRWLPRVLA